MKKYLILFALILIQGCGGSDDTTYVPSNVPTDPATEFQTFPAAYFTPGYTETINYTGADTAGGTYTATMSEETQAESSFLDMPAIPILVQLQMENTATGAVATVIGTNYYTTVATDRRYLGYSDDTTETVSATTNAIPQTVKIGDFGVTGTYTDNAGNISVKSWRIDDASNGNANIVLLTSETDQSGNPTTSSETTTKIDVHGNTLSETLVIYSAASDETLTLVSN